MTTRDDAQNIAGRGPASESNGDQGVSPLDLVRLIHLTSEYWLRADGVRQLPCCELFAESGELVLGSMHLSGRDAIDTFFRQREAAQRASGRVTRHVGANHVATAAGPGRVRMQSTVLVFSGEGSPPLPSSAPSGIADFEDICIHTPEGNWLFEKRVGRTVFIGAGAPSFAR